MNADTLREVYDAAAATLVKQYQLRVEQLTEKQLVDALSQALKSGDFVRNCGPMTDGGYGQSVTYIPGMEADRIRRLYDELLYAVETKHEGETRHETALRYIREREQCPCRESSQTGEVGK